MLNEQQREQLIFKYHKLVIELVANGDKLYNHSFATYRDRILVEINRLKKDKEQDNE